MTNNEYMEKSKEWTDLFQAKKQKIMEDLERKGIHAESPRQTFSGIHLSLTFCGHTGVYAEITTDELELTVDNMGENEKAELLEELFNQEHNL
jgi:hypothetical protein